MVQAQAYPANRTSLLLLLAQCMLTSDTRADSSMAASLPRLLRGRCKDASGCQGATLLRDPSKETGARCWEAYS